MRGILAFYGIVHLHESQLVPAFSEMFRVLSPGGILLLSFHVGDETIRAENFLDSGAILDFHLFSVSQVESALTTAGFVEIEIYERQPYDAEHPTTRCYINGCKLSGNQCPAILQRLGFFPDARAVRVFLNSHRSEYRCDNDANQSRLGCIIRSGLAELPTQRLDVQPTRRDRFVHAVFSMRL